MLGSGTSTGVPRIGNDWGDCDPKNPKNRRRRCSMLIERITDAGTTTVLIDTSPDMREQLLDAQVGHLDAVIYTHSHADHVHGIDDLRQIVFNLRRRLPVWADAPTQDALLSRFLDPDLYEGEGALPTPDRVTPLAWRMFEAIGEPLPTNTLPLAFAHAELRPAAGWKAQIEAAERLTKGGTIPPNVILGLYTERDPAASGGVWDRVDAFQRFEAALQAGDVTAVEQRLPLAYARMADVEIEVTFAALFAEDLARLPLTGDSARIAYDLGLLSPDSLRLSASRHAPQDVRGKFLAGLAQGRLQGLAPPDSMARALAPAFDGSEIPLSADARLLLAQNRIGEALFLAMTRIEAGRHGEMTIAPGYAAVLRQVTAKG